VNINFDTPNQSFPRGSQVKGPETVCTRITGHRKLNTLTYFKNK